MGVGRTNPASGLALAEQMSTEQLVPANNLRDLPNRVQALQALGVGAAVTVDVAVAAGASNVAGITVTAKDAAGATVSGVHYLELITTSDAAGTTISSTDYSGTIAATTGTIMSAHIAKHHLLIATDATGVWAGTLTDTSATADYIAVKKPLGSGVVVSSALAYGS